jgi:glutaminase
VTVPPDDPPPVQRAPGDRAPFVSTGRLPRAEIVARLVAEAHARFRDDAAGEVSRVYPALARVAPELFGIAVVSVAGADVRAGDADVPFTIMSVSKPFVYALVCEAHGTTAMRERIGANATGLRFDSAAAVDHGAGGRTNPMVNPGAIATTSFAPGADEASRMRFVVDGLSRFAGRALAVDADVYASASAANGRNQGLARLLATLGRLGCDPAEAVAIYTRQCCLAVTATDLAVMGATLASGGLNPRTGEHVADPESCHAALAVMATAGLYDTSGDWLYEVGLPGKSGIGGGIVTVAPGKGALATFAPPLDAAGNSVRGQLVARFLSRALGLDIFSGAVAADG